jgi:hypothetical protein
MNATQMLNTPDQDSSPRGLKQIIGHSPALGRVFEQFEYLSPTDSTVLIEGETGVGKELIARAIHSGSSRRGRSFVKLNWLAFLWICCKGSFLATREVRSPELLRKRSAVSNSPTKARSSWMRWATYRRHSSLSFCVFCRNRSSNA